MTFREPPWRDSKVVAGRIVLWIMMACGAAFVAFVALAAFMLYEG